MISTSFHFESTMQPRCDVNHSTPCHDGNILTFTNNGCFSDGGCFLVHRMMDRGCVNFWLILTPASFSPRAHTVQCVKKQDRIIEMCCFDQQIVGVLRRSRCKDNQLDRWRTTIRSCLHGMVPSGTGSKRYTNRHRTISTPTPTQHCCIVDRH